MLKYLYALIGLLVVNLSLVAEQVIEIIPNFPVAKETLNQVLKERRIDACIEVKTTKDYYKILKKQHGIQRLAEIFHLSPQIEGKQTSKILFFNLTHGYCKKCDLSKLPKDKLVLFMWEPPVVFKRMYREKILNNFSKIYTWQDDLVDNKRFFKFYYPVLQPMLADLPNFEEKKFCTMVSSNLKSKHPHELYSERKKVIEYFEKIGETGFEFYGRKWPEGVYSSYRSGCVNKLEVIKNYKFTICYENMRDVQGYITEKIFDCFAAGTIPIYWGASNITDTVPQNCFIDRRKFTSMDELHAYLKAMTKEEYEGYLEAIRAFLSSEKAQLYSWKNFEEIFAQAVQ